MSKKIKSNLLTIFFTTIILTPIMIGASLYLTSNNVTYNNTSSNLKSSNVKDAIDELYTICTTTIADRILEKVKLVTSGTGLYKDEYENRYIYKGQNPSNYITFNGDKAGVLFLWNQMVLSK